MTDEEYEIGNEFVPEIVFTQRISDISYVTDIMVNDDCLWVIGNETKRVDGRIEQKCLINIFDISDPSMPKQILTHEPKWVVSNSIISGNYIYLLCYEKNRKAKRIYFNVVDISDLGNPILVGKSEPLFIHGAKLYAHKDKIIAFEMSSSYGGIIDKTRIHTIDISDPTKPREISNKFIDYRGDEIEKLDGYVTDVCARGNFLYTVTKDNIYAFDISDKVKLVAEHKGSLNSFEDICLSEEYMSRDSNYIFALGNNPEYSYPSEDEKEKSKQNALVMLDHRIELVGSYPFDNFIGQPSLSTISTKLPFDARSLFSDGLLVFISGYEENEMSSPYSRSMMPSKFKLLVVDISYLSYPRFSGLLEIEGICYKFVRNNYFNEYVYTAKIGQGKEASIELITVRLPEKEGMFKREYKASSNIYPPGYKEPEVQPNPIEPYLRDFIDKPDKLVVADFKDIKTLDFEGKRLTDFQGIEFCKDLKELNLKSSRVTDLTPLSGLYNLKILDLSWNKVSDLEPLRKLQKLEELNLYANEVVDVTPLLDLPNLKKLNISRNNIEDFRPVTKMVGLTDLIMGSSDFFKPPYLGRLENLKVLNLSGDGIYNLGFIYSLPQTLEELNLNGNKIIDIAPVSHLRGLKKLSLRSNDVRDLSPLSDLKNLEELYLHWNKKIVDFSPLGELTNLKKLDLSENFIDDVSFLENLVNLEELDIYHINISPKKVSDISSLRNLKKLKRLDARENEIKDLTPLSDLIEITYINLDENQVRSVKPLEGLENLEDLRMQRNQVKDISPLSGLKKIKNLDLFGNKIKDVSCFVDSDIYYGCLISLGGNEIPEQQLDTIRKDIILLPDENEGRGLNGMVTIAAREKYFHELKGRYTKDPNEFVDAGVLYLQPGRTEVTIESMIKGYNIALFEVNDKGFTIVIKPEENVQGRTFAINEGGFVMEWLGKEDISLSKLNLDDDLWKAWPVDCRFSVHSCGSGG